MHGDDKRRLLGHLVNSQNLTQVLVFRAPTADGRLARELARDGFATDAIHGDKSQEERIKALDGFKNGTTRILVATDVAARGLDIHQLPTVVNYELPFVAGTTCTASAAPVARVQRHCDLVRIARRRQAARRNRKLIKRKLDEQPMPDLSRYGDRYGPRREPREGGGEVRRS